MYHKYEFLKIKENDMLAQLDEDFSKHVKTYKHIGIIWIFLFSACVLFWVCALKLIF